MIIFFGASILRNNFSLITSLQKSRFFSSNIWYLFLFGSSVTRRELKEFDKGLAVV